MNNPTILFFDSGVGGFSVYQEVKQALPNAHYLYCMDNAFFPYSEKSEQTIIQRVLTICTEINRQYPLDLIVIACNTASTIVLPALRETFAIPIVGTVPAVKPATEQSLTKHIGLLATKGTIKRPYVNDLIEKYGKDCQFEKIGSTQLVEIAEKKLRGEGVDLIALRQELHPLIDKSDLDSLILGCTHFPLIKEEIQLCLPQFKFYFDPGAAIAKRVVNLLTTLNIQEKSKTDNILFSTAPIQPAQKFEITIKRWGFERLELLKT